MTQNIYDDDTFFKKYSQMDRSVKGLAGAGEWQTLEAMLPDLHDKRLLDLGCGFGWHAQYAMAHGARSVIGVDISAKMLTEARRKNCYDAVRYIEQPIEAIDFPPHSFDCVLSSLALHYLASFAPHLMRAHSNDSRTLFSGAGVSRLTTRRTVRRIGSILRMARSLIFQWTATLRKGPVRRSFWAKQ